jgi:hypothetical protein
MPAASSKRTVEVRLLVIVFVDQTDPELTHVLTTGRRQTTSIADIVRQEVVSNLESVSYVDAALVSQV